MVKYTINNFAATAKEWPYIFVFSNLLAIAFDFDTYSQY